MSKDHNGLEPAKGFDLPWKLELEKSRVLRELIQSLESPRVLQVLDLAGWQKQIMEEDQNGQPHPLMDVEGQVEPD